MQIKPVPGFEDYYAVSDAGEVFRITPGGYRRLKPFRCGRDYLYVELSRRGQVSRFRLHRLILEVFVGPCPEGHEADHIDCRPDNNSLANLRWLARRENRVRGVRKLSDEQILAIRAGFAAGEKTADLARRFGVSIWTVRDIGNRRTWPTL